MKRIAFVFPGQGAQVVGMGRDFIAHQSAQTIYDVFNHVVDSKLSQICFEGPEDTLRQTLFTQPGILATSLAALELFRERMLIEPVVVAGHSLGEFGALYAAGVFSLNDVAMLIKRRAELMNSAPSGAMSAVLGLAPSVIDDVVAGFKRENPTLVVAVANYNSPTQSVISGTPDGVEQLGAVLKSHGAKRIIALSVGGAFHSPLMKAPADAFSAYLTDFKFEDAHSKQHYFGVTLAT